MYKFRKGNDIDQTLICVTCSLKPEYSLNRFQWNLCRIMYQKGSVGATGRNGSVFCYKDRRHLVSYEGNVSIGSKKLWMKHVIPSYSISFVIGKDNL